MYHALYEQVCRFASEGALAAELPRAKAEYLQRTGELFESDTSFERRIAAFLEWYVLERPSSLGNQRPIDLYVAEHGAAASPEDRAQLEDLRRTHLSLFEFKKVKGEIVVLQDLLNPDRKRDKSEVYERRKPAGLSSGDILEARLVPCEGRLMLSEATLALPREGRKVILKVAKKYKAEMHATVPRTDLVHRVVYFANRCERYKHVDPKRIFAELEGVAFEPTPLPVRAIAAGE
jgi:hypothetical protein